MGDPRRKGWKVEGCIFSSNCPTLKLSIGTIYPLECPSIWKWNLEGFHSLEMDLSELSIGTPPNSTGLASIFATQCAIYGSALSLDQPPILCPYRITLRRQNPIPFGPAKSNENRPKSPLRPSSWTSVILTASSPCRFFVAQSNLFLD